MHRSRPPLQLGSSCLTRLLYPAVSVLLEAPIFARLLTPRAMMFTRPPKKCTRISRRTKPTMITILSCRIEALCWFARVVHPFMAHHGWQPKISILIWLHERQSLLRATSVILTCVPTCINKQQQPAFDGCLGFLFKLRPGVFRQLTDPA